jgi:ectoine hydroxylase-related dioxygenase (phytanoyl-CoA dioxygenase family)
MSLLRETLNPPPNDPRDQLGNWGLWNFEGKGPEGGPPEFAVGQVGAVMSLPGCADQTIHADTAHLYVHTQLPAHYINLFLPAVAAGSNSAAIEVGQTAFILGSHLLRISAHVMNEEGGQEMLERRLVRPHLTAGDALLFDCRILHFGLANQYAQIKDLALQIDRVPSDGWRPLLYINYHQKFFHDPKNWNDKEKLFD